MNERPKIICEYMICKYACFDPLTNKRIVIGTAREKRNLHWKEHNRKGKMVEAGRDASGSEAVGSMAEKQVVCNGKWLCPERAISTTLTTINAMTKLTKHPREQSQVTMSVTRSHLEQQAAK